MDPHPGDTVAATNSDDDYGSEVAYDSDLEETLRTVEQGGESRHASLSGGVQDIEDVVGLSPMDEFRKRGVLSVSDLVGTVWCEVQYDYRLRTLPFLPPAARPERITTSKGAEIKVDKVKVEGKERILKRGEKIHKRLEREIHPAEVTIACESREDAWGLRLLNMVVSLETLISLGKCREIPVVGIVRGVPIMGIIDEITRVSVEDTPPKRRATRDASRQASLDAFLNISAPRPRTHRLMVSDSKTRASGTLPRESDTLSGRLQVMLYKELFDALLRPKPLVPEVQAAGHGSPLPTDNPSGFDVVLAHLGVDMETAFTDVFLQQIRPVIISNGLRFDIGNAVNLADMVAVWGRYVELLGLGSDAKQGDGATDDTMELVYRRAGPVKPKDGAKRKKRRTRRKAEASEDDRDVATGDTALKLEAALAEEEDADLQLAIALSLQVSGAGTSSEPANVIQFELPPVTPPSSTLSQTNDTLPPSTVQPSTPAAFHNVHTTTASQLQSTLTHANLLTATDIASSGDPSPQTPPRQGLRRSMSHGPDQRASGESDAEREEDELAWAVELSLGATQSPEAHTSAEVPLRASQEVSRAPSNPKITTETEASSGSTSGSIIGRTRFGHNRRLLASHLDSVLDYWKGTRAPRGVAPSEASRCAWCEFEDGCEWRAQKANEAWQRYIERAL
ncbi:putative exonuclease V, mitochondrial [Vanrija pseudolonga]|uniref:Exonuclease V, mitochondrial n=1 Tax=Vanrija pseudolonga TaxID=143232 RepID=A0AAF1BJ59_9TREE|nr:putative exonuclease V, mitochondrial [Vanrija pseudolonga]